MIYSFLLHCKLISEIMYLKKNLFACGQRLTDLLIMYSSWLHAGCQLVNTAAVCFVHTCRFKCFFLFSFFFFKKKRFLGTLWFPLSCDNTLAWCENHRNIQLSQCYLWCRRSCWRGRDQTSLYHLLSFRTES